MPTLSSTLSSDPVKILLVGHSGAGKTSALASLVFAGFKLKIIDMDRGLEALAQIVSSRDPSLLSSISFQTFRDKMKTSPAGMIVSGTPKAFTTAVQSLDKWEDGTSAESWGPDTVIVIDSLTAMGRAAFHWSKQMNPQFKDPRLWYAPAQSSIEDVIANLTGEGIRANVIVITHIDVDETKDDKGSVVKTDYFPSSVGKALGPKLPRYFNTVVVAETSGIGQAVRRQLRAYPSPTLGWIKVPKLNAPATFPIETGLADLFALLRG